MLTAIFLNYGNILLFYYQIYYLLTKSFSRFYSVKYQRNPSFICSKDHIFKYTGCPVKVPLFTDTLYPKNYFD